jgi:hypothetical protein
MAMTPDTPAFGCSPLDGLGPKVEMAGTKETQVPWTEEEDAILQTVSAVSPFVSCANLVG